jgi:hypothetical protein
MKRSEANVIKEARESWSAEYSCLSIKKDEDGEESEEFFSHHGCDICCSPTGLAGSVYDVIYLKNSDIQNQIFANIYGGNLCGGCFCSLVNGDDSDLDYSTTEEDCK